MFIATMAEGVPIEHLKMIVDKYYAFAGKKLKETVFDKTPLIPPKPPECDS